MTTLTICALLGRDTPVVQEMLISISTSALLPTTLVLVIDRNNRADIAVDQLPENLRAFTYILNYYGRDKQPGMRNLALDIIKSDYVWFIDDDSILLPKSLERAFTLLDSINSWSTKPSCIAGMILEDLEYNANKLRRPISLDLLRGPIGCFTLSSQQLIQRGYKSMAGTGEVKYPIVPFCQGTSMIYRTFDLNSVGGFLNILGVGYSSFEDSEPCFRLFKVNKSTIYCDQFPVLHKKAPRLNNEARTQPSLEFYSTYFNNYALSLSLNKYPNSCSWPFYIAFSLFFVMFKILIRVDAEPTNKLMFLVGILKIGFGIASNSIRTRSALKYDQINF